MIAMTTAVLAVSILVPVAIAGLIAIINALLAQVSQATNHRRESYASAVRTLVAWIEFPYRVRRRVDDEPGTLKDLADQGHTLQEQLEYNRAWIISESPRVAVVYSGVLERINSVVGPAVSDAWKNVPVSSSSGMVLGSVMDRNSCTDALVELEAAIAHRFGWRRFRLRRRDRPSG